MTRRKIWSSRGISWASSSYRCWATCYEWLSPIIFTYQDIKYMIFSTEISTVNTVLATFMSLKRRYKDTGVLYSRILSKGFLTVGIYFDSKLAVRHLVLVRKIRISVRISVRNHSGSFTYIWSLVVTQCAF